MSEKDCSCALREGAGLSVGRCERVALYLLLVSDLSAVGDLYVELSNGRVEQALLLRDRFDRDMRLLDDLGWEKDSSRERFELTMPLDELRRWLERVYWQSIAELADEPGQLADETRGYLQRVVLLCPALLSKIASLS